jgi:hypothetical protein
MIYPEEIFSGGFWIFIILLLTIFAHPVGKYFPKRLEEQSINNFKAYECIVSYAIDKEISLLLLNPISIGI